MSNTAPPKPGSGCTLAQYAAAKQLPEVFLKSLGITELPSYNGAPAVRIPYYAADGSELTVQFRLCPTGAAGEPRFAWKAGMHPHLYGLNRLGDAKAAGSVVLVEGPSDAQTLWYHDYPALGLPSACWKEKWGDHLDGIGTIYLVQEPGQGGDKVIEQLERSALRHRLKVIHLGTLKDASGLYLDDPCQFKARWAAAMAAASAWQDQKELERRASRQDAWNRCAPLASEPNILDSFAASIRARGVVGEEKNVRLVFLVVVSRILSRIVSLVVKGQSSAGKSYLIDRVLEYFPEDAYVKLTAMSEKALLYDDDTDVRHRMLVIAEAAGMNLKEASYYLRTLLSEGRLAYTTVEKTPEGFRGRTIRRDGPTGLILTTTAIALHQENETRLLSILVNDTPAQTREILINTAAARQRPPVPTEWLALQEWIGLGDNCVVIPFAEQLASAIPPVATRLRRDFNTILSLIEAHALLHQATRSRDPEDRVVATRSDYEAVRDLIADVIAEGLEAAIPQRVRETVEAVRRLAAGGSSVSIGALANELNVDRSTASRRAAEAERRGYIVRSSKGRSTELSPAAPLSRDLVVLPEPSVLFPVPAAPAHHDDIAALFASLCN